MYIIFFFSSRRRHTRCLSDWSSDVCSSDLSTLVHARMRNREPGIAPHCVIPGRGAVTELLRAIDTHGVVRRSEERRVGKECRYRWSADHEKKKKERGTGREAEVDAYGRIVR